MIEVVYYFLKFWSWDIWIVVVFVIIITYYYYDYYYYLIMLLCRVYKSYLF